MPHADEHAHGHAHDQGDEHRRDRVRIKHLQQLDIAGEHADEITFPSSFKLGRTKPAQRRKHMVADERQQLEGDIVVASLLAITQQPAPDAKQRQERKQQCQRDRLAQPQQRDQPVSAQHRDQDRAEEAGDPQQDSEDHPCPQRPHQLEHGRHDLPFTLHLVSPFHSFPMPAARPTGGQSSLCARAAAQRCRFP